MKIVFLSYYSGLNNRGVETWVSELSSRFQASGHTVIVYDHSQLSSPSAIPVIPPDTDILIPTNGRMQSLLSRIWCTFHHAKLVIAGQSGPGLDDRLNLYCFPDCFIGLTDFQCAWAKKINPFVRIEKISNGIDLNKFSPDVKPMKIGLARPIVLYTAALEPIKRHELLIRAVAKTNYSLLLVGDGSQKDYLNKLCKDTIPGRFRIMRFTPAQMPSVYTACDVFSYPTSPWESFGISILEALASGLPVVATDDPIRREIIGEAGLLSRPEDLSGKLREALEYEWAGKPVSQAKKYSWDSIIKRYLDLFTSLTAKI